MNGCEKIEMRQTRRGWLQECLGCEVSLSDQTMRDVQEISPNNVLGIYYGAGGVILSDDDDGAFFNVMLKLVRCPSVFSFAIYIVRTG